MKLKIKQNYVLINPRDEYETYQINGRETGILNSIDDDTLGERSAVFGKIFGVPERLVFNGKLIEECKQKMYGGLPQVQKDVDRLKQTSVLYHVPMEVAVGTNVLFSYKNQIDCYRDNRVFCTEDGLELILVKYDTLFAAEIDKDVLMPLNGFVFVERVELKSEVGSEYILQDREQMGMKKKKAYTCGRVLEIGTPCAGYLEFPNVVDNTKRINPGTYIFFDERHARNMQHELHQTHPTARLMVHRKDIHGFVENPSKLDINA